MRTALGNLLFVFQTLALNSARAGLSPPWISLSRTENTITFRCTTFQFFPLVYKWVLYRNSVRERTTDACTSGENLTNSTLSISSQCDGLYSCAVNYTDPHGSTGFVLSQPITVYGKLTFQNMHACSLCILGNGPIWLIYNGDFVMNVRMRTFTNICVSNEVYRYLAICIHIIHTRYNGTGVGHSSCNMLVLFVL